MSKSHYELTFIVDGNIPDTENNRITEEIQTSMKTSGAEVNYCQELGRKKLSYEIKKSQRGTYFVIEFDSEPNSLKSIEKDLKLNKSLLRYLIVTKPRNIAQIKPENVKDQTELKSGEKISQQKKEEKPHREKVEKKEEDKKEEKLETETRELESTPEAKQEAEEIKEINQESEETKKSDDLDKKLNEILNKDEF
ncbi:MAG: 30S ribosomal protein S6 [Patescibacteria group bacterium]|nr:30S ribosomal protein S6 [Patescibacteria group bacterium]